MTTEEQIAANQQNAQLGGVKTEEGKAISSTNATKHGILVQHLTDEEQQLALVVEEQLYSDYQPKTTIEEILIERIAIWYVRLQRVVKAETEEILSIQNPRIEKRVGGLMDSYVSLDGELVVEKEGYTPKVSSENVDTLANIYLRYETAIERNLYKALHELQRIQAERNGKNVTPPVAVDVLVEHSQQPEVINHRGLTVLGLH